VLLDHRQWLLGRLPVRLPAAAVPIWLAALHGVDPPVHCTYRIQTDNMQDVRIIHHGGTHSMTTLCLKWRVMLAVQMDE
jgi:hypothetical protein